MEEEYEKFEITDYDLDNEFNPNRPRRKLSKKQQIYGVFGDDSDDDGDEIEMKTRRGGKISQKGKDYTAPIGFISGGIQQAGKKKEEKKVSDNEDGEEVELHKGFGFGGKNSSDSEEEVRPSFKPIETAGMRTFKGTMSNKGLGDWEQHTRGIGAKLLLQMGYQPGKGLGKSLQGIAAPVEAHVRKGRGAIGAYGPEKKTKVADLKGVIKKDEKKSEKGVEERGKQWSKKGHKGRYFYKSVEDVIEKGKKPDYVLYDSTSSKHNKVTVIDMTGPEKRVLSGYHALGQMKISEDDIGEKPDLKYFQLPELMHNLNLIVNMCEQEIIANDKRQRTAEERQKSLMSEKEQLEKIVDLEKKYIEQLEDVEDLVEKLTNTENPPTLQEAEKIIQELKISFPNEFKEFGLSDLAPGIIAPLITANLKDWNPLEEPTKHVNLIKKWADLLDYSNTKSTTVFEPYPALIWSTIIPCFRKAASDWNPIKHHAKMAALLDAWSSLLPEWMLENVLDQIVLSRLTQAVSEWDPLTDIVPIHTWILPWSKILGDKMHDNVYKIICEKLSKAFRAWHPSDRSALNIIAPWKSVFRDEDLAIFLYKNVVPKLEFRMSEIVFNPLQQDLEIFNQVWSWNELLSSLVMASILDKYFFPKWMQTLVLWLNQSPNFDEVSRWYTGWKGMFNESVLKQPTISEHFRRALELMQRATGITLSMPEPIIQQPQLDMNIIPPSNINLEYKEIVSQKCAERGIIFAPMPGRRENGKQVYRIGKLFCYFEKSVCCVSSDPGNPQAYMPMTLSAILEKAK